MKLLNTEQTLTCLKKKINLKTSAKNLSPVYGQNREKWKKVSVDTILSRTQEEAGHSKSLNTVSGWTQYFLLFYVHRKCEIWMQIKILVTW